MTEAARPRYVTGLDGIRALAVGGVVAFHLGYLPGGYLGVDAFFVVSGFLITRLLVMEWQGAGGIGLRRFWARRVRRLFPALLLLLAAVAVLTPIVTPGTIGTVRSDGIAALLYVANWHAIAAGGYFAGFSAPSPLEHLWSLGVEEQFYLIWPLLLIVLLRLARGSLRVVLGVTALLAAASYAWMYFAFQPDRDPTRIYEGTDTRAGALLLGACLAIGWILAARRRELQPAAHRVPWLPVLFAAATGWLVLTWWRLGGTSVSLYRGGLLSCGLAAAAVVLACARGGWLAAALSIRALRYLGERSYAVYLWHWPVMIWLDHQRTGLSGPALAGLRVAVIAGASVLSYSLVERPIRRGWLPRWQGTVAVPVAVASVAALLVLPGTPAVASSAPAAPPAPTPKMASEVASAPQASQAPQAPPTTVLPDIPLVPQRQVTGRAPLRVLVLGDSFAWQAVPGIEAALGATDESLVQSFAFVGEALTADRYQWQQKWPAVLAQVHPDVVVVSLGVWDREFAAHDEAAYQVLVDQAVQLILGTGANVVWVEQPASGPPPERPGIVVFPTVSKQYVDDVYQALPSRYPGRVVWVRTSPTFDPNGVYTAFLPGASGALERVRMPDNFHICPAGAVLVAELVLKALAPYGLAAPAPDWATAGTWWQDSRYSRDHGGGGCARPDGAPPT